MSNRTAQANRAIAAAWKNEQELVLDSKGTRDWTTQQQQDIISRGKAYDEDGKAYQGHHMKSVEKYPEYQGDPGNIQFLSSSEHLAAHGGSFQNPSNGFYNPTTCETKDFGDNKYEKCEIIKLTEPIYIKTPCEPKTESRSEEVIKEETIKADASVNEPEGFIDKTLDKVIGFCFDHEEQIKEGAKTFIRGAGGAMKDVAIDVALGVGTEIVSEGIGSAIHGSHSGSIAHSAPDASHSSEGVKYPDRASPRAHMVSEYDRLQNGKIVHVPSYSRGGKKK